MICAHHHAAASATTGTTPATLRALGHVRELPRRHGRQAIATPRPHAHRQRRGLLGDQLHMGTTAAAPSQELPGVGKGKGKRIAALKSSKLPDADLGTLSPIAGGGASAIRQKKTAPGSIVREGRWFSTIGCGGGT